MLEERALAHSAEVPNQCLAVCSPGNYHARRVGINPRKVDEDDSLDALALGVSTERVDHLAFAQADDTHATSGAADDGER